MSEPETHPSILRLYRIMDACERKIRPSTSAGTIPSISFSSDRLPLSSVLALSETQFDPDPESTLHDPLNELIEMLNLDEATKYDLSMLNMAQFPNENEWTDLKDGIPSRASIPQLVLFLTDPDATDLGFQKFFLTTFPAFMSPEYLMGSLYTRYFADEEKERLAMIQRRVVRIIISWSKVAHFHFTETVKDTIVKFIGFIGNDRNSVKYAPLLQQALEEHTIGFMSKEMPPQPILPLTHESEWSLLNLSPIEIARQLTLMHSSTYRDLSASELLTAIWGEEKGGGSEHVSKLTYQFNSVSGYVSLSIISGSTAQERAEVYMHWVDVAEEFLKLQNYHGLFTVMSAIRHQSVVRMKETMKKTNKIIRSKKKKILDHMMLLTDISNDFANYRKEIAEKVEPAVPFIGCLQRDLIYIQESFPSRINNLINVTKLQHCHRIVTEVRRFQGIGYPFVEVPQLQDIILGLEPPLDLLDLMRLSQSKESIMN